MECIHFWGFHGSLQGLRRSKHHYRNDDGLADFFLAGGFVCFAGAFGKNGCQNVVF
jgi:hypothetical protein